MEGGFDFRKRGHVLSIQKKNAEWETRRQVPSLTRLGNPPCNRRKGTQKDSNILYLFVNGWGLVGGQYFSITLHLCAF